MGKMTPKQRKAYDFPVGSSFILQGHVFKVRTAYFEMNTQMRRLHGETSDEVTYLSALQREAFDDDGFQIL